MMRMLFRLYLPLLFAVCAFALPVLAEEIIPIDEVRKGMRGVWKTSVEGTEISEFPLEVVGVARNFLGPGKHLIFCQALDEENRHSGPVSGMSGSPVYLEGRLAGAYAYGFGQNKDQAVIGVTPIEEMLELWSKGESTHSHRVSPPDGLEPVGLRLLTHGIQGRWLELLPDAGRWSGGAEPLATSAFGSSSAGASGVSAGERKEFPDLEPGSSLAAVLMGGDFGLAAVGTVTTVLGGQILGFGHPFLDIGSTQIPMAGAEVLTVVRSYGISFKLSDLGPVVGHINQDRLPGVAGVTGVEADTLPVHYRVTGPAGEVREFSADVIRHPRITPALLAIGLGQSLSVMPDLESDQTYILESSFRVADRSEPVRQTFAASGIDLLPALRFLASREYAVLFGNPLDDFRVEAVTVEARVERGIQSAELLAANLSEVRVRSGDVPVLRLRYRRWQQGEEESTVSLEVPNGLEPGVYQLLIGGSDAINQSEMRRLGPIMNTDDLFRRLDRWKPPGKLYAQWLRPAQGVRLEGGDLSDLPPSLAAMLSDPRNQMVRVPIRLEPVGESSFPLPFLLTGSTQFQIEILPPDNL